MTRLTLKRDEKEEIQEAEVVTRWSAPKILIAVGVIALVGMFGMYFLDSLKSNDENVLGVKERAKNKAQIEIPSKEKVSEILEQARESISNIDTENLVDSQPQIKKAIEDLEKLTTTDTNAKKVVCDAVCK